MANAINPLAGGGPGRSANRAQVPVPSRQAVDFYPSASLPPQEEPRPAVQP